MIWMDEIRRMVTRRPFLPFVITLWNYEAIRVSHPEQVQINERSVFVHHRTEAGEQHEHRFLARDVHSVA